MTGDTGSRRARLWKSSKQRIAHAPPSRTPIQCVCPGSTKLHMLNAQQLVTGSEDYTVRLWQLSRGSAQATTPRTGERSLKLIPTHLMRSHSAPVVCVTASRQWSVVVSGSKDGSAAVWDLNRGTYIRSIWHGQTQAHAVHLTAINESTVSLQ